MSMRARLWITAMVLLGAACFAAADGPMLSVPMATAPVIDGTIGDGEWSGASSPWMFVDIASGNLASRQPAVWLSRDDAALYVAASLPLPPGKKPVAAVTVRDGAVWEDDAFEVFLDPVCDGEYKQLIVNSVGNQWDSLRQDDPGTASGLCGPPWIAPTGPLRYPSPIWASKHRSPVMAARLPGTRRCPCFDRPAIWRAPPARMLRRRDFAGAAGKPGVRPRGLRR